ncbi:MAG TPA: PLP-dependent aminotransferase family protein [Gemmatimonadaceae bacterium]|nr:PLP-dependent aminotransferase family protein [Gemmatimonadaceae bacterium]
MTTPPIDRSATSRRGPRTVPLLIPLDPDDAVPQYRQIYNALRRAILEGTLRAAARLPASRVLADDLGVSRTTVLGAYAELAAEGLIVARSGAGTVVGGVRATEQQRSPAGADGSVSGPRLDRASDQPVGRAGSRVLSERATLRMAKAADVVAYPTRSFALAVPALDVFPVSTWSRLAGRRWRATPYDLMRPDDGQGYAPLRRAIAEHVLLARGVHCTPDQVVVVSGALQAIDIISRLLLDAGDEIWFEEPGYRSARGLFDAASARIVSVPVDDQGLDVAFARRVASDARVAFVTPAHQAPLGVTMSIRRRLALLDWAVECDGWIIEDDYAGQFRYDRSLVPAMRALAHPGARRVLHLGSFTETLFPALRIGYVVLPAELLEPFVIARRSVDRQSPTADQAVLADFIDAGHFARHIRRMRMLYAERQQAFIRLAARELGSLLRIEPMPAGMHLIGWLPPGVCDACVAREAGRRGVEVVPLSASREEADAAAPQGLLLGYAPFSATVVREALMRLAEVIHRVAAA